MYTYKTEILTVSTKWFSDKANAEDKNIPAFERNRQQF